MRFLDVEHYLGLRGSDTWSRDGNEGTVVTKWLIGSILARHLSELTVPPNLYLEFARRLEPDDTVLTFNYDTLLERALDAVGKPYRLFPTRYESISQFSGTVDNSRDEVVVLKVHGSIDWFDRSSFEDSIALNKLHDLQPPEDVIFSHESDLGLEPLIDGPCFNTDPLKTIYRARNLEALYGRNLLFRATPSILPPSAAKLLYAARLNDFWRGMGRAGYYNSGMAIIGFSLPAQDEYARQIVYQLVRNYQGYNWKKNHIGAKKTPLAIVDFFPDAGSKRRFQSRYQFVDWSRAALVGTGFNKAALSEVFA